MQAELAEQLNQYTLQLLKIEQLIERQPPQSHLQVLKEKIGMKVRQLRTASHQLAAKQHSNAVITQMGAFFKESFTTAIKQTHRMVQIRPSQDGQQKLKGKISVIREMEEEMGSAWQAKRESRSDGILRKLSANLSTLAQQLDQGQLRSVAKEYLQRQFLAIRVIAYRLYEQYVAHTHPATRQLLQQIRNEQELLRAQVEELKEVNKELKGEEKRMMRELNQLKKVNDLIGKRYFVQESRTSPGKQSLN